MNVHSPIAKIIAKTEGIHGSTCSSDKSGGGGLLRTLYLCQGAKVMLTSNLLVKYGLFNGSVGTIIDIIYPPNESPKTTHPVAVMVEFHKYTGPPFIKNHPRLVPIVPIQRK